VQLDLVLVVGEPGPDGFRAVGRVPVDNQVDLVVKVSDEPGEEVAHDLRVERLGEDHEVHPAAGADRGHRVYGEPVPGAADDRRPGLRTPGATGDLVRADADLVGEEDFTVLCLRPGPDGRPGLLVPEADRFRVLLDGPLIEHGLPDGGLLGLGQDLVFPHATTSGAGQQCVPSTGLPLGPPVVHFPGRHLEQSGGLYTVPALHQRGHRKQPHSLLRVRRPGPPIPHQITHTPSTSLNPKRFRSIGLAPATIKAAAEESLRRLRTDHIDLYYPHFYRNESIPVDEIIAPLDDLVTAGKVRATVALAWLAQQPTVTAPIASARTVEQLPALFAAQDLHPSDAELRTLTAASS